MCIYDSWAWIFQSYKDPTDWQTSSWSISKNKAKKSHKNTQKMYGLDKKLMDVEWSKYTAPYDTPQIYIIRDGLLSP